jgi:hypothetical protein
VPKMDATQGVTPVQDRQVLQEALQAIQGYYDFERRKQEEWFEVDDREMAAYHRGQLRGLRLALELLESKLKLVEARPQVADKVVSAPSGFSCS